MKLYYYQDSERLGPIASVQLRNLARKGEITPATIIESQYGSQTTAGRIGELFPNLTLDKEFAIAFPELSEPSEPAKAEPKPRPRASASESKTETKPRETVKKIVPSKQNSPKPAKLDAKPIALGASLNLGASVKSVSYEPPKYEPPKFEYKIPETVVPTKLEPKTPEPAETPDLELLPPELVGEPALEFKTPSSSKPDVASKASPQPSRKARPSEEPVFVETPSAGKRRVTDQVDQRVKEFDDPFASAVKSQNARANSSTPPRAARQTNQNTAQRGKPDAFSPPSPQNPRQDRSNTKNGSPGCLFFGIPLLIMGVVAIDSPSAIPTLIPIAFATFVIYNLFGKKQ